MKKLLLSLTVIITAFTTYAQIPAITAAGVNPVAGDVFYMHYCDTDHVSKGPAGAGVTWDLTTLHSYREDTTVFVACASTPYCDTFPGSTLASGNGVDGYDYYISDAAKFAANGYASSTTDANHFSDPQNLFMFPMTYGDVKVDSYQSQQPAFSWFSFGTDSFYADAYGTLKLPTGTYTNVLRVRVMSHSHDSNAAGSMHLYTRGERYMWFSQGMHFPVLMMLYDTSGGASYLSDVMYITRNVNSVNDLAVTRESISVYPNPASGTINIKYESKESGRVAVVLTDMTGRAVLLKNDEVVKKGNNTLSYSMAGIPVGTYLLRIQTDSEVSTARVMVVE